MNEIIQVNSQTVADTINDSPLTIVDFTADWCAPCRMMHPIFKQMAEKYGDQVSFITIDTEENPDIIVRYGVQSLPTFTFFRNGEAVKRLIGARPGGKFEAEIQAFVAES